MVSCARLRTLEPLPHGLVVCLLLFHPRPQLLFLVRIDCRKYSRELGHFIVRICKILSKAGNQQASQSGRGNFEVALRFS